MYVLRMSFKRIALLMGKNIGYNRDVIEGIYAFSQKRKNWLFHDASPKLESIEWLQEWKPDGIIAHLYDAKIARAIEALNVPIVSTTDSLAELNYPLADVNQFKVGEMAAEYLSGLRLRNFGYLGSETMQYSKQRFSGFNDLIEGEVHRCWVEYLPRIADVRVIRSMQDKIRAWLSSLPKPVGVFCSNDVPARDLADICLELGIRVPEEVAILGVDNDLVECRLSRPPLSSIEIPSARIGYGAAEILDKLMSEDKGTMSVYQPDPIRVVERESTSMHAVADPELRKALVYIKSNFSTIESVNEIVAQTSLGRRSLERKFRMILDGSILDILNKSRIEFAKSLLSDSKVDLSVTKIADACGYNASRRFAELFKLSTKLSPSEYARLHRVHY